MSQVKNWLGLAGLWVLLLLLPYFISEYQLNMVITMAIYSLYALSFNILFGQGGLISFGHAAYFGIGAYTSIILFKRLGLSLLPGIIAGGVSGAFLGILFGVFVVRRGGVYFALLTLAFNMLIYAAAEKWRGLTGGEDGVASVRSALHLPGLASIDMFSMVNWYYFVIGIVFLGAVFCWYFTKTPLGRLNEYLRENEDRARFIGYNVYASKLVIYVISTFLAGLAGGLAGSFQEFVTVTFINMDKSAEVLQMAFIGGSRTFWGPILGACFLRYFTDLMSSFTEHWPLMQGAIFILLVMYLPQGLSGVLIGIKRQLFDEQKVENSHP